MGNLADRAHALAHIRHDKLALGHWAADSGIWKLDDPRIHLDGESAEDAADGGVILRDQFFDFLEPSSR